MCPVGSDDRAAGAGAGSAEDRLVHLIDRLLIAMEAASSSGAWGRVTELAE